MIRLRNQTVIVRARSLTLLICVLLSRLCWSGESERPQVTPELQVGPGGTISYIEAFPDGGRLLSADNNNSVGIWQINGGWEVQHLPLGGRSAFAAAVSPDETMIVAGGTDGRVTRYSMPDGRFLSSQFNPEPGDIDRLILRVVFSSDGQYFATSSQGHFVKIWSARTGDLVRKIRVEPISWGAAFIPGTSLVLVDSGTGEISAQTILTGEERYRLKLSNSPIGELLMLGPDRFAWAGKDGELEVWSLASQKSKRIWGSRDEHRDGLKLSYHPRGHLLLAWQESTIDVYDVDTGKSVQKISPESPISALCVGPRDGTVFVALDMQLVAYSLQTGRPIRELTTPGVSALGMAFSPDGQRLAMGSLSRVNVWKWRLGILEKSVPIPSDVFVGTFKDDNTVITTSAVVTRTTPRLVWRIPLSDTRVTSPIWQPPAGLVVDGIRRSTVFVMPSVDGSHVLSHEASSPALAPSRLRLWDTQTGMPVASSEWRKEQWLRIALSPDQQSQVTAGEATPYNLCAWAIGRQPSPLWCAPQRSQPHFAISPDSKLIATQSSEGNILLLDLATGRSRQQLPGVQLSGSTAHGRPVRIRSFRFSTRGDLLEGSTGANQALIWRIQDNAPPLRLTIHGNDVGDAVFSPDDRYLAVAAGDGIVELWDIQDPSRPQRIVSYLAFDDGAWASITPEGYYRASPQALRSVGFRIGQQVYPFDEFDLLLNRPDKVVQRLGADPGMVASYKQLYTTRLRMANMTEEQVSADFHVPEVAISPEVLPVSTDDRTLPLEVTAQDPVQGLRQLNIAVNGVPLYGNKGLRPKETSARRWVAHVSVPHGAGDNRVQVTAGNESGAESRRFTANINYNAQRRAPTDLYVLLIGVSKYTHDKYRLDFAAKDARDIGKFWQGKEGTSFSHVYVRELLDGEASKESIAASNEFLERSGTDDEVVIFLAGHGVRDADGTWFFATADIDFAHPGQRGLAYEAIETLVDGLQARKRLILIDTCFAGERVYPSKGDVSRLEGLTGDVTGPRSGSAGGALMPGVKVRAIAKPRGEILTAARLISAPEDPMLLLQSVFVDLRRGTGAQVIAAAGAAEFAYEGIGVSNGTFTTAVLDGLSGKASPRGGNTVTASELLEYVTARVLELTGGRQRPLARQRNLNFDFALY